MMDSPLMELSIKWLNIKRYGANQGTMSSFFSDANFMPHGHCYLWNPNLIRIHTVSDGIIAFSYYCIPFVLYYLVKKRPDVPYKWIFVLFATFILACGTTHIMEIRTLWHPDYWLSGFIKLFTAIISVLTAISILPIVPKVLKLRGPKELEKLNSQLEKALNHKSIFLANMSHEIRTPLNGILGLTNHLLDMEISPEQKNYLEMIKNSGNTLCSLLNDILDFSKIEAGKLELEYLDFDLHRFIQDTLGIFNVSSSSKNIRLDVQIDPSVPRAIRSDPSRIRQILNNLLSNAVKFTSAGGTVKMAVSTQPLSSGNDLELHISVTDTGIGISPENQKLLFSPFTQADASSHRKYGGTGLGLSICRLLVQMMGGEMSVSSELGKGSTFQFSITVSAATLETTKTNNNFVIDADKFKNTRILIAEDNQINQVVVSKLLEKFGISPQFAFNGNEVLEMLKNNRFDLIFMDCQMPELDGYQTTKAIRELKDPKQKSIYIIAMTANAIAGEREKCLQIGMNDYLSKPLRIVDLSKALESYLKFSPH